jgi:hypothetical protein
MTQSMKIEQAEKVAENLGGTIESETGQQTPGGFNEQLKENIHPAKNQTASYIKLLTYFGGNVNNNNIAVEKYYISPRFKGILKNKGTQKNIWYLPLPNSNYAIKFYAPNEYDENYYNYVFAVPAVMDSNYITGLRDYTTGVPQEWINSFVQYASSLPNNIIPNTPSTVSSSSKSKNFSSTEAKQTIKFTFNFWGSISGTLGKSSSFSFKYSFYPGAVPAEPIANQNQINI